MKFTPKANFRPIATGMLAIAVGLSGWAGDVSAFSGIVAIEGAFAGQETIPTADHLRIVPVAALAQAPASQAPHYSQSVMPKQQHKEHWYKNKHWWKRNAPIIGGAGGGALVGGLAGGGTGALIGGAAGGGGGYLYKRLKRNHHHHHHE
jgi:hypothetical protein